jgi:16S rRNA (cytosine1402-N4)-methyltransferase
VELDNVQYHVPVLLKESVEFLLGNINNTSGNFLIDFTLGGGGYTKKIAESTANDVKIIAFDRDINAINQSKVVLENHKDRIIFCQENFSNVGEVLNQLKIYKISGVIMDLGLSTYQINNEDGFSYLRKTPLDMRAGKDQKFDASVLLNKYSEKELTRVFRQYAEIRYAHKLSGDIVTIRRKKPFNTTFDLVEVMKKRIPERYLNRELSRIFQAIRIEVNDELNNLSSSLDEIVPYLEPGARVVAVSYHSLEDRIVKNKFKNREIYKILTKKPVYATDEEIKLNVRSRSAKLRAAEKIN